MKKFITEDGYDVETPYEVTYNITSKEIDGDIMALELDFTDPTHGRSGTAAFILAVDADDEMVEEILMEAICDGRYSEEPKA